MSPISNETKVYMNLLMLTGLEGMQETPDMRNPEVYKTATLANKIRITYMDSSIKERQEFLELMSQKLDQVDTLVTSLRDYLKNEALKINSPEVLNSESSQT